jgi:geranylgeranyl diphosphate synthase type II
VSSTIQAPLPTTWQRTAEAFEQAWPRFLRPPADAPPKLVEAVQYTFRAGGKRIRPFLVLTCCRVCGGEAAEAMPAAVAIECVHTFSLIHDDLPALDDDDLRRGMPANHKVFGEAMALLAGDALLSLAFDLLGRHVTPPQHLARMVRELAEGAGWQGMIGGQVADLLGEQQPPSRPLVDYIHRHKTGRLLVTACRLGALAADADDRKLAALSEYGAELGLAFQIADDLLDVAGSEQTVGKRVGKDAEANKQTYPAAVGMEASRQAARSASAAAIEALRVFGSEAEDLRVLAEFVVHRHS